MYWICGDRFEKEKKKGIVSYTAVFHHNHTPFLDNFTPLYGNVKLEEQKMLQPRWHVRFVTKRGNENLYNVINMFTKIFIF